MAKTTAHDWNLKNELGRKIFHLGATFFILIYIFFSETFSHKAALLVLAILLVILLEIEYVRIDLRLYLPFLSPIWEKYKRKKEKNMLGGDVFFLIGCIICLAVFDVRIAVAAILMTTFGDLASSLVGKCWGKIQIMKDRSLEGCIAEFVVNIIVGYIFLRAPVQGTVWWLAGIPLTGFPLWSIIITMALTATIVETLVYKLDDNLLVPLISGLNGHLLLMLFSLA